MKNRIQIREKPNNERVLHVNLWNESIEFVWNTFSPAAKTPEIADPVRTLVLWREEGPGTGKLLDIFNRSWESPLFR